MKIKQLLSLFLSLVICILMMPMTVMEVFAGEANGTPQNEGDSVSYVYYTANGNTAEKHTDGICNDYIKVDSSTKIFEEGKWYVVSENVTVDGRIYVNGSVNLILCDDVTLTTTAGTNVGEGNSLNIYAQENSTGTFISNTITDPLAGIGSGYNDNCGTINIHGGNITAKSGAYGAGIGGGYNGSGGYINIFDGVVYAEGTGGYGAGIGGGKSGEGGHITIYGGNITANARNDGAGIGGGREGNGGTITINGGTINATAAEGIGGGRKGNGGIITINGGNITAIGEQNAGIGGGYDGSSGEITINGGTIIATGNQGGAGIGGGYNGNCDKITINDGYIEATGTVTYRYPAGIGGGESGNGGTIIINGGTVISSSYHGIGAGYDGQNGNLILGNGVIFAAGEDKDNIDVTGDNNNATQAFDKPYFESLYHVHTFDQEVVEEKYLKNKATCIDAAKYYKSCKCGVASKTDIFTNGDPLGHEFSEKWEPYNASQHKRTCKRCEKETEYESHNYDGNICTKCGYAISYKVSFDMNGHGSAIPTQTVKEGNKVKKPVKPTAKGYKFKGWYADKTLKTAFDFNTEIHKDTTIYARWKKVSNKTIKPKTGDNNHVSLWIVLFIACIIIIIGERCYRRKKSLNKKNRR